MKRMLFAGILCVSVSLLYLGVHSQNYGDDLRLSALADTNFIIRFAPYPPKELNTNATPRQLVQFAWEEFLALNWKSSYLQNQKRDSPDLTWNYQQDQSPYPALAVWETYAHRTELRPYNDKMLPFDAPPHYSFGTPLTAYPGSNASFDLFQNLDENSEIGSCEVFAHVQTYDTLYKVLYQAKTNRDEYEYLLKNYNTKAALLTATTNTFNNIKQYKAYYKGATSSCNCPQTAGVVCLPCGGAPRSKGRDTYTGAMEVKTAWRELTAKDDPAKFFTRKVIYYRTDASGKIYYDNKIYALIGLHIIHKTQNYPAFIFATWEHVDVESDNMGYVKLNDPVNKNRLFADFKRLHPIAAITDASSNYVHQKLKKYNPNSIWQNYRLVGVQSVPTNNTNAYSFFLANYVIESDSTLANFHGSGIGKPFNALPNTLYKGNLISMGGCQGCHGVAQTTLGGDFSFLMDTVGKPVQTPDIGLAGKTAKIKSFIKAFAIGEKLKKTGK
ncbi:hypothetical protein SAMN04515674_106283 [Pseudarcicella hirudinis]|uniref:Uncharacterized protein n=1 Tax=Pseudarcicella hirudinis TaxID=1079859 RepID=A0A1I5TZ68_9BACT|nr:hypothetical protein [Pseudarcicella hirudinis]SFP88309.1 hypothetical protein SAMN04515674_106283 [Pseudarcicella hirudinis]